MEKVVSALGKIVGWTMTIVMFVYALVTLFVIVFGTMELAWWLIFGEWIHIVNPTPTSIF